MNRNQAPRDPEGDAEGGSELIELHESRLPSRLDVPPASVRSLGRRLDPRLAAGVAVAIVVVALLGTGPLAPHPTPTPSVSRPVALESMTPEPTADACPPATAKPPTISLGARNQTPVRSPASALGETPDGPAVVVPVKRTVGTQPGGSVRLDVYDNDCVELVGIDLLDTARPQGGALTIRIPAPLDHGSRTVSWDAPPAGDWVVRVALRLRAPLADDLRGPWAVYFFRLNSGYVAWASPAPDGGAYAPVVGPLATPGVPCGPAPAGPQPPVVNLVSASGASPGILGDYQWQGTGVAGGRVPEALLLATPVEVPVLHTLLIADSACATNWSVLAGVMPTADQPFNALWDIDQSPENPTHNPLVAAQNTIAFLNDLYGTYVIQASFTFQGGDRETVYWHVRSDRPPVPEARVVAVSSGEAASLAATCGASYQLGGRYGTEFCAATGLPAPEPATLTVAADSELRASATGFAITNWMVTFTDHAAPPPSEAAPACFSGLTSGWSEFGLASLDIPTLPPGDWDLQVALTLRAGADSSTVPYLLHLVVLGPETPAPSCAPPGDVG